MGSIPPAPAHVSAQPTTRRGGHLERLQIWTQDVDALCAQVQAHQAVIFLPMEETWYRRNDVFVGNRQFIVQDPDGYMLRFAKDLGVLPR